MTTFITRKCRDENCSMWIKETTNARGSGSIKLVTSEEPRDRLPFFFKRAHISSMQ